MLFSIILLTAIMLAASFGLHIMPLDPIYNLSDDLAVKALYVCPAASNIFDSISTAIRPMVRYMNMAFFFSVILLLFFWGWGLYQNLLKDAFNQELFKKPWAFTKVIFWIAMILMLFVWTPNHYRMVHIKGATGNWVFCEENTPGAKAVLASAVKQ